MIAWKKRDPIPMLEARMAELGVMSAYEAKAIHAQVKADAAEAIDYAEASPFPEPSQLLEDVYYVAR